MRKRDYDAGVNPFGRHMDVVRGTTKAVLGELIQRRKTRASVASSASASIEQAVRSTDLLDRRDALLDAAAACVALALNAEAEHCRVTAEYDAHKTHV